MPSKLSSYIYNHLVNRMPSPPQGNHPVQSDVGDGADAGGVAEDAGGVGEDGRAIVAVVCCGLVFGFIIARGYDSSNTKKRE